MLITSLLPLLSRYSLGCDLVAGSDAVTVTIIPRKATGSKHDLDAGEVRPISITGTAAEIDAELAKGADGALGQLIAARKSLADQIAEQRDAAEQAKTTSAAKTKGASKTTAKPAEKPAAEKSAVPADPATPPPAAPTTSAPGEPASLW